MPSWRAAVTTMFVPGGVCVSALSIRIRMTCATLSGSTSASTVPAPSRSCEVGLVVGERGPNSLVTASASTPTSVGSRSQLERAGLELGEVEQVGGQLLEPLDLLAHLGEERLARLGVERPRPASSSRNPPSEKIGVRSSCDAVAMNRLRAVSSWPSWRCMSSSATASWPSSSSLSTDEPPGEVAARDAARGALEPLDAPRQAARDDVAGDEREAPARSRPRRGSARARARRCPRRR